MSTSTKQRLLIVEDDPLVQKRLYILFSTPPDTLQDATGVSGFDVDCASTGSEAEALLRHAAESFQPYDVTLLDLELPDTPADKSSIEVGKRILKAMGNAFLDSCTGVIVQSAFSEVRAGTDTRNG